LSRQNHAKELVEFLEQTDPYEPQCDEINYLSYFTELVMDILETGGESEKFFVNLVKNSATTHMDDDVAEFLRTETRKILLNIPPRLRTTYSAKTLAKYFRV
jgi:hypothetical protein